MGAGPAVSLSLYRARDVWDIPTPLGIPILFNPSSRDYGYGSRYQIIPRDVIGYDDLQRIPSIDDFFFSSLL
jgi:hypothetical protein